MILSMILHAVHLPFNCKVVYIDTVDGRTPELFGVSVSYKPYESKQRHFSIYFEFQPQDIFHQTVYDLLLSESSENTILQKDHRR